MSKALYRITLPLLLLAAVSSLAAGQQRVQTPAAAWKAGLREVDEKLRAKKWEEAEKQARKMGYAVIREAGTGEGAAYSLAVVSAFRAIAEAGLGREEDAAWHWDMALNLFPDISKTKVSPYGPEAVELQARRLRTFEPAPAGQQMREVEGGKWLAEEGAEIIAPKPVKYPYPNFPEGLRQLRTPGLLTLEIIIGPDGRPRNPVVLGLSGGGPAMKYVALDALREWRFEPAQINGKPATVYYVLRVNFQIR
jgi:TonB family protein